MSGSLAAIRDALVARVQTIPGLRAHDTWPEQVHPPAVLVRPVQLTQRPSLTAGRRPLGFELVVVAAPAQLGYRQGQDRLDTYLDETGTTSLLAALEGDLTLGGTVTTLDVLGWRDYGTVEISGIEYFGAIFDVTVYP